MSNSQPQQDQSFKHFNKSSSNSRGGGYQSSYNQRGRGGGRGRGGPSHRGGRGGSSHNPSAAPYAQSNTQQQTAPSATTTNSTTQQQQQQNGYYNRGPPRDRTQPYNRKYNAGYVPQHDANPQQQQQQQHDDQVPQQVPQLSTTQYPSQPTIHAPKAVKYSDMPFRTTSAPPNLGEQQQKTVYFPQKRLNINSKPFFSPAMYAPTPVMPVGVPSHQMAPRLPVPHPNAVPPAATAPINAPVAIKPGKKVVEIVNPITHKKVDLRNEEEQEEEEKEEQQEENEPEVVKNGDLVEPLTANGGTNQKESHLEENGDEAVEGDEEEDNEEEGDEDEEEDNEDDDDEGDDDYDSEDYSDSDYSESDGELPPGQRQYSREYLLKYNQMEDIEPPADIQGFEIFCKPGENANARATTGYLNNKTTRAPHHGHMRHGRTHSAQSPLPGRRQSKKDPFSTSGKQPRQKGKKPKRQRKDPLELLHKSENAYKVGKTKDELQKIIDDVRGVLNRLTPEKYDVLKQEFLAIPIPDEETLTLVIDTIFEKAVLEPPHFASIYAQLCKDLASSSTTGQEAKEKLAGFKRTLLNKCQQEFESEKTAADQDVSQLTEIEKEIRSNELRKRKIGNIIFIGELFDKKMLSERIIHEVIKKLLIESPDKAENTQEKKEDTREDDLERLCKLLTTIGKTLDRDEASKYMDFYFNKMKEQSQNKDLSSRIRFMLLDVIELRENKWVPRIKTAKAKTIKELHAEAEKEKKQKELALKQSKASGKYYKDDKGGKGYKDDRRDKMKKSESFDRSMNNRRDQQKKGPRYERQQTSSNVRLGPASTQNAWNNRQDSRSNTSEGKNKNKDDITTRNAFSELADEGDYSSGADDVTPRSAKAPALPSFDAEHVESRTKGIFNTWVEENIKEESIQEFKKENFNKEALVHLIRTLVFMSINKQDDMNEYFKLLLSLHEEQLISLNAIERGLKVALKEIIQTEYVFDAPKAFDIYGRFFGRCIFEQLVTFSHLQETLEPFTLINSGLILTGNQAISLLTHVMQTIVEEHDFAEKDNQVDKSRERLCKSSFNLLHVLDSSHKKQVQKYAETIHDSKCDTLDVVAHIVWFVEKHHSDSDADEQLLKWLNENLGDNSTLTTMPYATKIFSALLVSGEHLDKTNEFVEGTFSKTYQTVVASAEESAQVKCLFEVQRYCNNKSNAFTGGVFERLLKLFVEKGVFGQGVPDLWFKDKKDKTPGKDNAVASVKELFF